VKRVFHRLTHVHLRGQVVDDLRLRALDEIGKRCGPYVDSLERELADVRAPRVGEVPQGPRRKIVDAEDLFSFGDEPVD
jgi:hypothetical protein